MLNKTLFVSTLFAIISIASCLSSDLNFELSKLYGDYTLTGVYNSAQQEPFRNFKTSKCFNVSISFNNQINFITITYTFYDTARQQFDTTTALYSASATNLGILVSHLSLFNWHFYNGDQDLFVAYLDDDNDNVILVQRDRNLAFVLSGNPTMKDEIFDVKDFLPLFEMTKQYYTIIDNNDCMYLS